MPLRSAILAHVTKPDFIMARCATKGVDAVVAATGRTLARHTHDQYGLGVIHSGGHRSHSGRGQVEATVGDVITVNPGEVHDGAPLGGRERAWRILYFDPALLQSAASDVFAEGEFEFTLPVITDKVVATLFERLFIAETAGEDEMRRDELLLGMTAAAGRYHRRLIELPVGIALAKARIDDDPIRMASLAELAAISGLSRFQLIRGFMRSVGLTPHAYVVQRRIDLVRRLIAQGERLARAAVAAGFADQSHMSRSFVRRYGVSPGEYARAIA